MKLRSFRKFILLEKREPVAEDELELSGEELERIEAERASEVAASETESDPSMPEEEKEIRAEVKEDNTTEINKIITNAAETLEIDGDKDKLAEFAEVVGVELPDEDEKMNDSTWCALVVAKINKALDKMAGDEKSLNKILSELQNQELA